MLSEEEIDRIVEQNKKNRKEADAKHINSLTDAVCHFIKWQRGIVTFNIITNNNKKVKVTMQYC